MENPQKIKHFARAMLSTTKTDEIDAKLIATYGEKMTPAPYKIPTESIILLKQKRTVLRQLKKQLTATINLQQSLAVLPKQDPASKVAIEQTILATGGFTYFSNAKQISRFLGLCPTYQQSGTSVNFKGHINRNGDTHLRSQMYVAAFASIRYNAACRETYERLRARGKSGKLAVVAVANKLIRQAFAVVTNNQPYIDGFVSSYA